MAANTDKLKKYKSLFSTTLSTGIGTGTGDTITPATVTGLPTDTAITLTFDRVDSGAVATPSKLERITGVISGGNLSSYVRAKDSSTEQAHTAGAVIEMVWNAQDWNDMVDWGLAEHNQDGTHSDITASTISASTVSASAMSIGGIAVPTISSTSTLTNKRNTKRVTSIASNATPTINTDNCDVVTITALATAITSMTTNLSGTPTNFQTLVFRILDDGTNRAITWGASFQAMGVALPTTTTAGKVLTVGFIYDTEDSKWSCVASVEES